MSRVVEGPLVLEILRKLLHLLVELLLQVSRGACILLQRWVFTLDSEGPPEIEDIGGHLAPVNQGQEV